MKWGKEPSGLHTPRFSRGGAVYKPIVNGHTDHIMYNIFVADMPRKRDRKTEHGCYGSEALQEALKAMEGGSSLNECRK